MRELAPQSESNDTFTQSRGVLHRRGREVYNNRLAASADCEAICLPSLHLTPTRGEVVRGASSSGGDRGVFSHSSRTLPEAYTLHGSRNLEASCSLSRACL